jgi:hypothetical protein
VAADKKSVLCSLLKELKDLLVQQSGEIEMRRIPEHFPTLNQEISDSAYIKEHLQPKSLLHVPKIDVFAAERV